MSQWKWKFQIRGTFVRAQSGEVLSPCEAIVESGVRDDRSPFALIGVGPIARANAEGTFHSWFVTKGCVERATCPSAVSVFVRVAKGFWEPYVVPVTSSQCNEISPAELLIELGNVQIEQTPYAEP